MTAKKIFPIVGLIVLVALLTLSINKLLNPEKPVTEKPVKDFSIIINTKHSLGHLGSLDSFDITQGGTKAGQFMIDALENNNMEAAKSAIKIYKQIIPTENYGGEYGSLQWIAEYLIASDQEKQNYFKNNSEKEFFHFFGDNNYANLKEYINRKYHLQDFSKTPESKKREALLEDTILFINPRREDWEKTSKVIEVLNLQKGQRIADVGSGPGYYTFQFSQLVGDQGKIFSVDTVEEHLNYIKKFAEKYGIKNVETIQIKKTDTINVPPGQVDLVFMCSLYHVIYLTTIEAVKDRYVESIKKALKPGGTFVLVDNALITDSTLPYHGPYIAKELIIGQMENYGFRLEKEYQFIPQRYILFFKVK